MGISVDMMRTRINELYNGHFTKIFGMPDNQVIAIYYQKLNGGAFDKKKNNVKSKKPETYYQMSIFDYDWEL